MRLYARKKRSGERVWWASWTEGRRTIRRSTRCTTRAAAELVVARWERERADPVYAASRQATLGSEWVAFIAQCKADGLAPGTLTMYRQKAGNLMCLLGKDARLSELDAAAVSRYVATRREDGASESTIYKEWITLRGILKSARHRERFQRDPAALKPPRLVPSYVPRQRWLTPCEVMALIGQLPPHRADAVRFVVATGARKREWESARSGDIDSKRRVVLLRGTKTAASYREVPVPAPFAPLLDGVRLPIAPWHNSRRGMLRACRRAKIQACTWNDLRRTFASLLIQSGAAPHVVARLLGHTTTTMVDRVYGKTTAESLRALLDQQLGFGSRPTP